MFKTPTKRELLTEEELAKDCTVVSLVSMSVIGVVLVVVLFFYF